MNSHDRPMADHAGERLLRLLRVPPEPAPPPGDPTQLRVFRAADAYFGYSVAVWVLKQISAATALLFSYLFFRLFVQQGNSWMGYAGIFEQIAIAAFVLQLPFSFALLRLDFQMRWYILSDRSLRIRSGILKVREQTMTFANVQNISLRQNPLQRLFGICTVAVQAAGGGASAKNSSGTSQGTDSHEARFEGVADGHAIRAAIRDRVRMHRDAGLGDPDDHTATDSAADHSTRQPSPATLGGPADMDQLLQSARRLRDEAAALRGSLLPKQAH